MLSILDYFIGQFNLFLLTASWLIETVLMFTLKHVLMFI